MKQMSRDKKNKGMGWWIVLFLGLVLVWSLSKGLWEVREGYKRVEEARKVLSEEEERKEELRLEYEQVQNDDYIEEMIRNDLNMHKAGEIVVILQSELKNGLGDIVKEEKDEEPSWVKWWNLIN